MKNIHKIGKELLWDKERLENLKTISSKDIDPEFVDIVNDNFWGLIGKELEKETKNKYSEEDMQEYATFCIRCYEQGLPCIIAQDWFKLYKN